MQDVVRTCVLVEDGQVAGEAIEREPRRYLG